MSEPAPVRSTASGAHRYLVAAALVGATTGLAVAGFERLTIDVVFDRAIVHFPVVFLSVVPGFGLALTTVWLRWPARNISPATADEYIDAFHDGRPLRVRDLLHRLIGAVITLGTGCALGLEGPSIYLGSVIGDASQRRWRRALGGADRNLLLVAGAAAGIAAIFKAPATGAMFALEVPYQDDLARGMLLPALVGAASGYVALAAIDGTSPLFPISGSPLLSFADLSAAAALGLTAGFGAQLFARMLGAAKRFQERAHPVVGVVAATCSIAALYLACRALTGQNLLLTPGYGVVTWAADPKRSVAILGAVLVLRCCATTAAVGGGGVGGLFVPLVVAGALLGRMFGDLVTHDPSLFLVIGVAAFLGAGYRVPIAAITFVAETTGKAGFIVPALIAAVVAEIAVGSQSVTTHQLVARPGTRRDGNG